MSKRDLSDDVLQQWKDDGLADDDQNFDLVGSALSTFVFYCKDCDHLLLGACIRDKEKRVSAFFQFGSIDELERLQSEIGKAIAAFKDEKAEREMIDAMDKDGYLWWTLFSQ